MPEAENRRLDVLREGERSRRGVPVRAGEEALDLGGLVLPYRDILWTSRRGGLLMIFAREDSVVVKGASERLDELNGAIGREAGTPRQGRAERGPPVPAGETVVCTAGAAVTGEIGGETVSGLRLAVFTRTALHLFGRGDRRRVPWPVDRGMRVSTNSGGSGDALMLQKGDDWLRLLYLSSEEMEQAIEVSTGWAPEEERAAAAGRNGRTTLEMFSRGDVAPPVRTELPRLELTVDTLQEAAAEAAGRLPAVAAERSGLGPHFFEVHLLELGEIALGPLLLRKSAATGARSLRRAAEAFDAGELEEDTRAALINAGNRLGEIYGRELQRLLVEKRAPSSLRNELQPGREETEEIRRRIEAPFEERVPLLRALKNRQRELVAGIESYEAGPPEGERGELEKAAEEWASALRRVDRGYEGAWREAAEEIAAVWEDNLLDRLDRVAALRRRRVPEWLKLVSIGTVALVAAAVVMILIVW